MSPTIISVLRGIWVSCGFFSIFHYLLTKAFPIGLSL